MCGKFHRYHNWRFTNKSHVFIKTRNEKKNHWLSYRLGRNHQTSWISNVVSREWCEYHLQLKPYSQRILNLNVHRYMKTSSWKHDGVRYARSFIKKKKKNTFKHVHTNMERVSNDNMLLFTGAFPVTDDRVFNGPLGRSLCLLTHNAHSTHSLRSAPLCSPPLHSLTPFTA